MIFLINIYNMWLFLAGFVAGVVVTIVAGFLWLVSNYEPRW
jgi:hypothetical protein